MDNPSKSNEVVNWLMSLNLRNIYSELENIGVTDMESLLLLEESFLSSCNIKPLEKKKLIIKIQEKNSKEQFSSLSNAFGIFNVDSKSAEFETLKSDFFMDLQGVNSDYVGNRIMKGLPPLCFHLISAKKIHNPELYNSFQEFKKQIAIQQNEDGSIYKVYRGYHGTQSSNLEKIALNGLLRIGHPNNPSTSTDPGYFGDPRYGIYIGRYIEYTFKYTRRPLQPLSPGDKVKILRFKIFPGKSIHIKNINLGMAPTKGYHSHQSPNHLEWFLFDERQCLPDYILEIEAYENFRFLSDDGVIPKSSHELSPPPSPNSSQISPPPIVKHKIDFEKYMNHTKAELHILVEADTQDPVVFAELGYRSFEEGDYFQCEAYYLKVIKMGVISSNICCNLASSYNNMKDFDVKQMSQKAIKYSTLGIEIDSTNVLNFFQLGLAYMKLSEVENKIENLEKSITNFSDCLRLDEGEYSARAKRVSNYVAMAQSSSSIDKLSYLILAQDDCNILEDETRLPKGLEEAIQQYKLWIDSQLK